MAADEAAALIAPGANVGTRRLAGAGDPKAARGVLGRPIATETALSRPRVLFRRRS
jgi:hypothetical protein